MSLQRSDFGDFFAALHGGSRPFAWQERLLDAVLEAVRWPHKVIAPTGAGKTAVIDVHVFAQALTAPSEPSAKSTGGGPRLPRRLSMVVARRVLVDDQYEYAQSLAARLKDPDTDVLELVAQRLRLLRHPAVDTEAIAGVSPLVVGRLRGGQLPSLAWRDHPTAVSVLCATPDMWGSRLLFRGYGSSWRSWPREAGLLAFDSVVVVDEAHLSRQLLCTARRVAELAAIAEAGPLGPVLQVVETTATPDRQSDDAPDTPSTGLVAVGVEPQDLAEGPLEQRLTRPKPVTLLRVPGWDGKQDAQRRKVASAIADAVVELFPPVAAATGRQHCDDEPNETRGRATQLTPTRTVGCFVNTVTRAVEVAAELRTRAIGDRLARVVMVCGQVRPYDLERLDHEYPGLLGPTGNDQIDVLVTTQSLEVGVDLDLHAVVSELASGSALAQRVGRVNRRGLRPAGPVTVVVPQEQLSDKTRSGPYDSIELSAALAWVDECVAHPDGMAPWTLRDLPPPQATARRVLFQRPELAQAWHWARTSDCLAAEPELDLWLAEDLQQDSTVSVIVRDHLPTDPVDAAELVLALPPRRHEMFSVPYRTAVAGLTQWGTTRPRGDGDNGEPAGLPDPVVYRDGEAAALTWRSPHHDDAPDQPVLRPGDVVVVDARTPLFTASTTGDHGGFSPPVFLPAGSDGENLELGHPAHDVLAAQAALPNTWQERESGGVVLRLEPDLSGVSAQAFIELDVSLELTRDPDSRTVPSRAVEQARRQVLTGWLQTLPPGAQTAMLTAALKLLARPSKDSDLVLHHGERAEDGAPALVRVLLLDRRKALRDEEVRQVITGSNTPVTLAAHQQAVAERAALLAERVGLHADLVRVLYGAGAHHDDGKQDDRFQILLGAAAMSGSDAVALAKSVPGTTATQAVRRQAVSGLPGRWRHEQRSVVEAWDTVQHEGKVDPLLVTRLIGTSHGHGRAGFPHTAAELLNIGDGPRLRAVAVELFDDGLWDELIEVTQQRYGVWGCAYLEALLRAADGQVSQEGS